MQSMGAPPVIGPTPQPTPYGVIRRIWEQGNVVPFLGAGASLVGRSNPEEQWISRTSSFYPKASELADFLAGLAVFPSNDRAERTDLAKVSSYYALTAGRRDLRVILREELGPRIAEDHRARCQPGQVHALLASLRGPRLIVTTNYDTLIEQAFEAVERPYTLLVYPADRKSHGNSTMWIPSGETTPRFLTPNSVDLDFSKAAEVVIFKMHGSITQNDDLDSFVITEEDYVDFLARMTESSAIPVQVLEHMRSRSLLFLGYSLRDWNLRLIFRNLNRVLTQGQTARVDEQGFDIPSWAIFLKPSAVEETLWERRSVKIYDEDVETFAWQMLK